MSSQPHLFEIEQASEAWRLLNVPASSQQIKEARFRLPTWYRDDLDPLDTPYRDQQLALWRAITGRSEYQPDRDEETPEIASLDPIRRPGLYSANDAAVAGDHLMAMGHILKISGLTARQRPRILEYGAGFGQIALTFARIGFCVETVDISANYCNAVAASSEHYKVDLTPHIGAFGYNPAGQPHAYDLVFFYESFHHCLDFQLLVHRLVELLKPSGKVLLAGEPIVTNAPDIMPYPWGIRLDGENVAVTHARGWMELGFQEEFLVRLFEAAGFRFTKHPCANSHYATVYEFTLGS